KRIGAGAAIAWSAPVLTSLRIPAFAAAVSGCGPGCTSCLTCGTSTICSGSGCDGSTCLCSQDTDGRCFCAQNVFGSTLTCTSSADCLANERCMVYAHNGCGQPACLPACTGTAGQSTGPFPGQA